MTIYLDCSTNRTPATVRRDQEANNKLQNKHMLLLVAVVVVVVVVVVVSHFGNISSSNKTANINVKQDNVQTNMESVQCISTSN